MERMQHFIKQKRELLERETISRPAINYSEGMAENEKEKYIHYLVDRVNDADLDNRAMHLVLDDFVKEQEEMKAKLSKLEAEQNQSKQESKSLSKEIETERKKRIAAERKAAKLEAQLKYAQNNQFGDKRQKVKKDNSKEDTSDRNNEKEEFDGTSDSLTTDSASNEKKVEEPQAELPKKERDLTNRPETYKTMGMQEAEPLEHLSDRGKVPRRILDSKIVKVFRLDMCLIEEHFEMVHYVEDGKKPKWGYFPKEGHPQVVTKFKGTKVTPEFLQALAYEVYVKNVTFGLLHQWITDMGMTVSVNTLRNWLKKGKVYLDKLVIVLKSIALEKDSIVNCDETWCKVRKYDHYKKCYIWVLVNKAEKIAIFFYEDGSRGRDVLTNFLGDAELKNIMSDGYNAYVFIGDELKTTSLKNTIHQVCPAHCRAKFVKAENQGGDKNATGYREILDWFFSQDRQSNAEGVESAERERRRKSLESKSKLIELRSSLIKDLAIPEKERTSYFTEALNYLNHFWKEIFAFLDDGTLPIDNNLAERTIRKLTTQRNSMLHFGSDEGVEMAATYHSVISTVKLHGQSAWEYLGCFFKKIFKGCVDYANLTPQNIGLASANS